MKLVRRLTVCLLLVIGAIVGADAWLGVREHLLLFEQDQRRDDAALGQLLATVVETVWRHEGEAAARSLVSALAEGGGAVKIRLVSLAGDAPPELRPELPGPAPVAVGPGDPPLQARDESRPDGRFYTYAPLALPDRRAAAVELSEEMTNERVYTLSRLKRNLSTAVLTIAAAGLVAWVLGAWMVGRPVQALIEKARRIGEGDFSRPLASSRRDELARIAGEMNAMAERLAEAMRRIEAESEARVAAVEQLRHADRLTTVGKLAAGLAHELGTPLNVVAGRAQMIESGETADGAETVECARIIHQQAERMTAIVRQLLDFARRRRPEKVATDVAQLARQTASLLEPLAGKRRVQIAAEGPPEGLVVPLDPSQIQQALANLVVNGIQATRGPGSVRVRVFERRLGEDAAREGGAGPYAVLEVSDEGDGIPADRIAAIFDPFFTTKDVGEGTGLGLSVAHGIALEHGGWIEVASAPGAGSRFQLWLPKEAA